MDDKETKSETAKGPEAKPPKGAAAPASKLSQKAIDQGLDRVPPAPSGLIDAVSRLRRLGIVGYRDLGDGVQVDLKAGGSVTYREDRLK